MKSTILTSTIIVLTSTQILSTLATTTKKFESERIENGSRILFLSFFNTKSHQIIYEPLLLRLAERGHEVTIVSPIPYNTRGMPNVHHILVKTPSELAKNANPSTMPSNVFQMKESKLGELINMFLTPYFFLTDTLTQVCETNYGLPAIQKIISQGKGQFDLILFPTNLNECLYGLIHLLDAPLILLNQLTVFPWVSLSLGTPVMPSFVPNLLSGFSDRMNFGERILNFVSLLTTDWFKTFWFNPKMENIYRQLLHDPSLPSIKEIEVNTSIVLCNSHTSFTRPKPLLADVVDVGGMHLEKSIKALPKNLEEFVSGSGEDGFILFSMGSSMKGSEMGEKYRNIFLNTFAKLRQRVIWKWETEEMDDLPKNVLLSKWIPQQDVLGHKNIKLFISHGGHGSTQEAIFHGVPLVGLPMLIDQMYNMHQAAELGFAVQLDFTKLTEDILGNAINQVLHDPKYRETAKRLGNLFHDQIDAPLDRAVWHVEYTIRHQGAVHLRSAARELSTIQYYSLDVIGTLSIVLIVVAYMWFVLVRKLVVTFFPTKLTKCSSSAKSQLQMLAKKGQ